MSDIVDELKLAASDICMLKVSGYKEYCAWSANEITRLREQLADAEKVIARLDYYARDESSTLVVNHMVQQYRNKYGGKDE